MTKFNFCSYFIFRKYQCNFDLNNIFCEIIKFSFEENIQKISDLYERNIDIKKIQEDLLDQLNENQTIKQNELFFQYLTINLKLNEEQILYRNTKKKILKFTLKLILSLYEFLDLAQTGDEKYETIENFISLLENKVKFIYLINHSYFKFINPNAHTASFIQVFIYSSQIVPK